VDERRAERLGEALALQRLLFRIHRVRDVDGEHEREVDFGLGPGGEDGERQEQGEPCGDSVEAAPHHRVLLVEGRPDVTVCQLPDGVQPGAGGGRRSGPGQPS
jgi:hypothetical protein